MVGLVLTRTKGSTKMSWFEIVALAGLGLVICHLLGALLLRIIKKSFDTVAQGYLLAAVGVAALLIDVASPSVYPDGALKIVIVVAALSAILGGQRMSTEKEAQHKSE